MFCDFYNDRDLHPEKFYSRNPDGSVRKFDDLPPGLCGQCRP